MFHPLRFICVKPASDSRGNRTACKFQSFYQSSVNVESKSSAIAACAAGRKSPPKLRARILPLDISTRDPLSAPDTLYLTGSCVIESVGGSCCLKLDCNSSCLRFSRVLRLIYRRNAPVRARIPFILRFKNHFTSLR